MQETCLIGQFMGARSLRAAALTTNAVQAPSFMGMRRLSFLIVYNFFDKCLNRVFAEPFGAPKGCGSGFIHRLGRSQNQWDV